MIISSMLDNDYYKFTMQQFVFHQFPDVEVEYEFYCRTPEVDLSPYAEKIEKEIRLFCRSKLTEEELTYLRWMKIFQPDYRLFLENFFLEVSNIDIEVNPFRLKIKGKWLNTILMEVPILAIISEIYCSEQKDIEFQGFERLDNKIKLIRDKRIIFADFGTRRRKSFDWHERVIRELINIYPLQFIGTSNLYFAMKYGLKPIGTMAHELGMACQALTPNGLETSQKFMMMKWLNEYHGELGILLTDVINTNSFLKDFRRGFAEAYSGCRQDSGNPYEWGEKLINHYETMGIDPKKKTAIFSDGLDFEKMIEINNYFRDKIGCMFGIGTNLTNDVGMEPLNIVIKMTRCNGKPVAKISDSPGKSICEDSNYLKILKMTFGLE